MPERSAPTVPTPSPEHRKVAAQNFDHARKAIEEGNHDYGIDLLLRACRLDPANFHYRQQLRRAQKGKFDNNLRGSRFAFLTTPRLKQKVKAAKAARDYLGVLERGEAVLVKNPWDMGTQMDMAEAFDALGLLDLAVFSLDQARQKYPKNATLNRALARLFEKRGDFQKAIALWMLVKQAAPGDVEASHKATQLAASETIARGGYESKDASAAGGSQANIQLPKGKSSASFSLGGSGGAGSGGMESADRLTREAAAIQKRLEADPTEPTLYVQLATLYRRFGAEERARAVLQQGLGPTGQHHALQIELHEMDLAPLRKGVEAAERKLRQARAKAPDDTAADVGDDDVPVEELKRQHAKLARDLLGREAELLRLRADRAPGELIHRLELGARLLKLDKIDEAIAELQQARRDEKLKGRASLQLALGFRRKNNWRLAQRNLEDALAALPAAEDANRKEALYQLATGCAENGDLGRAVDVGHELANIDFGYKDVGKLLDEWHAKAGR